MHEADDLGEGFRQSADCGPNVEGGSLARPRRPPVGVSGDGKSVASAILRGTSDSGIGFPGLRTVTHPVPDLLAARDRAIAMLGLERCFDAPPCSVGIPAGGDEFGLDPDADIELGPVRSWDVVDADAAARRLVGLSATADGPVQNVGGGIRTATFTAPGIDGVLGVTENPHSLATPPASAGPGR